MTSKQRANKGRPIVRRSKAEDVQEPEVTDDDVTTEDDNITDEDVQSDNDQDDTETGDDVPDGEGTEDDSDDDSHEQDNAPEGSGSVDSGDAPADGDANAGQEGTQNDADGTNSGSGDNDPGDTDSDPQNATQAVRERLIQDFGPKVSPPPGYILSGNDTMTPEMFNRVPGNDKLLVLNADVHRVVRAGGCKTPTFVLVARKGTFYDQNGVNRVGM